MKNKYYMFAGLPGTFLECKATINLINEKVIESCFKAFDVVIENKRKYFQPTAPLAVVKIVDSNGELIFYKEEIQ